MKSAAFAIALTMIASAAFAQGRGSAAPAAGGRQPAVAPGSGPVFTPGGVVLPGVVAPPTATTSQGTVVAPGVTATPGVVPPSSTTAPTDARLQPGVGQPLTSVQPAPPMTVGPQLGAGIGSQPGGFPAQGAQTTAPATGLAPSTSNTGGALTTIAPGGFGSSASGTADARSSALSPSTAVQAPRAASPILIDVPAGSTATPPVSGADAAGISDGALGAIIEGMMLSEVVAVDRERSCMTLRSPDGTTASYRFTSSNTDRMVAVGDQVVIEMVRPLLASSSEPPSASPRMSGRSRDTDAAAATGTATSRRSSVSTIISPLHQPGAAISSTGERCERSGTQPG